ncbi:MAG: hypothetical protein ACTHLT_08040 [Devosia sp.]
MSGFFIVKGELAAWALGLEEDDLVPAEDVEELMRVAAPPPPRRRKRRLGHETYRQPALWRRELAAR